MKLVLLDNFDNILLHMKKHSRHRSLAGFMLSLVANLIVYSYQPKKLSFNLNLGHQSMVAISSNNRFQAFKLNV
jgi:hypothetical protein